MKIRWGWRVKANAGHVETFSSSGRNNFRRVSSTDIRSETPHSPLLLAPLPPPPYSLHLPKTRLLLEWWGSGVVLAKPPACLSHWEIRVTLVSGIDGNLSPGSTTPGPWKELSQEKVWRYSVSQEKLSWEQFLPCCGGVIFLPVWKFLLWEKSWTSA